VDTDGDGKIDQWKSLPPEEATAESVAALASRDWARFASVLLTPQELQELGLGAEKVREIRGRIEKAEAGVAP
jgi:hypothetical protein